VGKGQDVGLCHKGELPLEALPAIRGGQPAKGALLAAAAGQIKGEADRALDTRAGVNTRFWIRDLFGRPLAGESPRAT